MSVNSRTALMSTSVISAVLGLGLMTAPMTMAQEFQTMSKPADQTFLYYKQYLSLRPNERDKINVFYLLKIKGGNYKGVSIILTDQGQNHPLSLQPDGRITPLPTLAQLNNGATITVTGPDKGVSLRMKVTPNLSYAPQMDGNALAQSLSQAQSAEKKMAGALAFAVPKLSCIYFVGAKSGTLIMNDGSQKPLTYSKDSPEGPDTPMTCQSEINSAKTVQLNKAPHQIYLGEAPH